MGDNFHWGYFADPGKNDTSLAEGTKALVRLLGELAGIVPGSSILDIGCGIGEPATILWTEFGCQVTGISNSPKGIAQASDLARQRGHQAHLQFHLRDALSSQFGTNQFDVAWLMEMSHLISDKQRLIDEATRVVKPGGTVALCDLTFRRRPTPKQLVARLEDHKLLKRVFGEAQLETLEVYWRVFTNAGLEVIAVEDISLQVVPTLAHWEANAERAMAGIADDDQALVLKEFAQACGVLREFYRDGAWGYGCLVGRKPQ
jgi:cyclopropane fatty-acyl-phospholipid synthase-like methyltransferase